MSNPITPNPHFNNVSRPIYEIYHLLPEFKLNTTTTDPAILKALNKHANNSNEILLHGLQALLDLFSDAACEDNFIVDNEQLRNVLSLVSLNINLLESNLELMANSNFALKSK